MPVAFTGRDLGSRPSGPSDGWSRDRRSAVHAEEQRAEPLALDLHDDHAVVERALGAQAAVDAVDALPHPGEAAFFASAYTAASSIEKAATGIADSVPPGCGCIPRLRAE